MKARTEHRIPLTDAMIKIILRMKEISTSALVFEGAKHGSALSDTALSKLTKALGGDITVHGFRSTFRDWCGDETNYPRELAEAALAHVIENKAEAAYRRSDAIEKRRAMMNSWTNFCNGKSS